MLKKLLIAVVAAVVLGLALVLFLVISLDSRIAKAVEEHAGRLTGAVVDVGDVDLSIRSGQGVLSGLSISNPEGFSENPALFIDRIRFEVDLENISLDLVPLSLMRAEGAALLLEKNPAGKVNYQVLSSNLKEFSDDGPLAGEEGGFWEPNLKISRFLLNESRVRLVGFGQDSREITISALSLEDVGGAEGMPLDQVGEEILSGLFSEVIRLSVRSGIQKWIEDSDVIPEPLKELLTQGLGSLN